MIHDIILSLASSDTGPLTIAEFTLTEVASMLHPGEPEILDRIIRVASQYKDVVRFIQSYGTSFRAPAANKQESSDNEVLCPELPKGLYLQAFCNGLNKAIQPYRDATADLEHQYLEKPDLTLLFIYQEVFKFQALLHYLLKLINSVKTQRLHGCMILEHLQKHSMHGDEGISAAIRSIQRCVYVVFIKQLFQWLMYGRCVDTYGEFFIQQVDHQQSQGGGGGGDQHTVTSASDSMSIGVDLWRYQVHYEMLPFYFPSSWAENVLFVGQTVIMFNSTTPEQRKAGEETRSSERTSLWGDKESEIFKTFHNLQNDEEINIGKFEETVDMIKRTVTDHLSDIAINEAELMKQLKLIKDFYLIGRGELFHEFIKASEKTMEAPMTDATARDLNRAFTLAASNIGISEELDRNNFQFVIPKELYECFSIESSAFIERITLRHKVRWPLHLLFSPKVMAKYNELFRFLLRIKKIQHKLQLVWSHHREKQIGRHNELLQLRNRLIFLVDNLQYYLQVDVLESQFCILMNSVQESKDFDHIQRAHTIFQANVMSLCFLLPSHETTKLGIVQTVENPILTILNKIISCIDVVCKLCLVTSSTIVGAHEKQELKSQADHFDELTNSLLKMLVGLKTGPSSQLLLRLDYSYWFSSRTPLANTSLIIE